MPGVKPDGYGSINLGTNFPTGTIKPIFLHNTNLRTWGTWLSAELHPEDDGACYGIISAGTGITAGSVYFTEFFINDVPLFQGYKVTSFLWQAHRFRVPFIRYPEWAEVGINLLTVPIASNPYAWMNVFKYREEPVK